MSHIRNLLDDIADEFEAEAVVLIVLGGPRGSGVGVKIDAPSTAEAFAQVPALAQALRDTADRLLADAKAELQATGN